MKVRKYIIDPVPKPRMTRSDKWKKRPAVERFFAFRDKVKLMGISVPESCATIIFNVPMPKSWSKKKKSELCGQAHQQKPDKDNLEKALLDSVYEEDCIVWDTRVIKLWDYHGSITIIEGANECFVPDAD